MSKETPHPDSTQNRQTRDAERQGSWAFRMALKAHHQFKHYREKNKDPDFRKENRERATIVVIVATAALVCWQVLEMVKVYEPIKEQAIASARSVKVAEDTLVATQRPWVSIDVNPAGNFHVDQNTGALWLATKFGLKNTGRTPAVGVWISADIYAATKTRNDPVAAQERACARPLPSPFVGYMIFPDETIYPQSTFFVTKENITDVNSEWKETLKAFDATAPTVGVLTPMIVGCVIYRFTYGEEVFHRTGFIAQITGRGRMALMADLKTIEASNLEILRAWTAIGNRAD